MQATPPFLGARVLAPSGPAPSRGDKLGPKLGDFQFWEDRPSSYDEQFFSCVCIKQAPCLPHDPSEIDFARPTQASSVHHNCERPFLQEVFRCGRRFRIDAHRPNSLVRGRGQRKKTQGSRTTSEISQITQRRCAQKAGAAECTTRTRPVAGDGGTRAATGTTGEISGEKRRGSCQTPTQVGGSSKAPRRTAIL